MATDKQQLVARVGQVANGVALKKDTKGFYVTTHRARSRSYPTINAIPASVVGDIEKTGSLKTAGSLERTLSAAITGAVAGALAGSRRSIDDALMRGMVQGALTGALAGGAAAQATKDQSAHFAAGAVGGYLGSRGPMDKNKKELEIERQHNAGFRSGVVAAAEKQASAIEWAKKNPGTALAGGAIAGGGLIGAYDRFDRSTRKSTETEGRFKNRRLRNTGIGAIKGAGQAAGLVGAAAMVKSMIDKKAALTINLAHCINKLASESNIGHAAELAGLGILAAPSVAHFLKKPMKERTSHKVNAAGLAVLAAPSLIELAKRHKKVANANDALIGNLAVHGLGGYLGYHNGKTQKLQGEKHTFGGAQIAGALLIPGGAAYQIGRKFGHDADVKANKKPKPNEKKAASDESIRAAAQVAGLASHGIGGYLGYQAGKKQKARGEKHTVGGKQIAGALLLPGGLAYQIGRKFGHDAKPAEKKASDYSDSKDSYNDDLARAAIMRGSALARLVGADTDASGSGSSLTLLARLRRIRERTE